jgi:hypothetical protein
MFTLGTGAIQYIAGQAAAAAFAAEIEDALVAFVGTIKERDGGTDAQGKEWPPTVIVPRSVFFLQAADPADASGFTASGTQTAIYVTVPNLDPIPDFPTQWKQVGSLDPTFFQTIVRPMGGYANAVYQIPRGNSADMAIAPHMDGYPFYARDTKALYVYDTYTASFINITNPNENHFFLTGMMVIYPEQITQVPPDWIRCNGAEVRKVDYMELFLVIEDQSSPGNSIFGIASDPAFFVLPTMSNTIMRI